MPVPLFLGDVVQTRKQHPCGNDQWTVTRVGADIKIRCNKCGRVVMLERTVFEKRIKRFVSRGSEASDTAQGQANE